MMKTNMRIGLGRGMGSGYKNILPKDSYVHALSAKGVKQTSGAFSVTSVGKATPITLKQIGGDVNWEEYGGQFIVPEKFNNGDFDYWLIVKFDNMSELTDDYPSKYRVEIQAVAPSQVSKDDKKSAFSSMGIDDKKEQERMSKDPQALAGILAEYGTSASLYSAEGNNANALMKEAKKQIPVINGMFGFYMDRPMNRIGNTGWDFIKGDIGFHAKGKPLTAVPIKFNWDKQKRMAIWNKKNAMELKSKLKPLVGKDVAMYGGGGHGISIGRLEKVEVERPIYFVENKPPQKSKTDYEVIAKMNFAKTKDYPFAGTKTFSPHLGSWKIAKLEGSNI